MNSLAIIGTTLGGAGIGGVIGMYIGFQEGGDFNFAPMFYGPIGGLIGGLVGVVGGSVLFA